MRLIKYDNGWNDPVNEFDSFLHRLLGDRSLLPTLFDEDLEAGVSKHFRIDSFAHEDGYSVIAELPGIPKEAIEVKLENAVLTIRGEHREGEGDDARHFKFSRSVTIGDDIEADKVLAKLENGLLTVSIPKSELRKPKAITVN